MGEVPPHADRKSVWLDCDPGHDDALAIILAGYDSRLRLLGVSTVAGNQTVEKVTLNALGLLTAAGLHSIPVVQGQAKPLMRPAQICPAIHGESGLEFLDGSSMQDYAVGSPVNEKAVLYMHSCISSHAESQPVALVCTGALTNAALLVSLFPELLPKIEIVLMGGCLGTGNTGSVAEFNIQSDPEAAKIVFECGAPVTMVPLEVTHTALATPAVLQRLSVRSTPFLGLMRKLLLFFAQTYREVFSFEHPPLHDPLAVFYVACPEAFKVKRMRVDIETSSPLSAGQTVCDIWGRSPLGPNATVALEADVDSFWESMIAAVMKADMVSPLNSPKNPV
ncbi:g7549 [Coccomyxa viridis]|uniref:G7549 protein n=1 Tax=Coccomyxa viridis TaxID=1274662 RepID=A0ABP1G0J3_9CHLO